MRGKSWLALTAVAVAALALLLPAALLLPGPAEAGRRPGP